MTMVAALGAEWGILDEWAETFGTTVSTVQKRTGNYSYQMNNAGYGRITIALNSEVYVQFAMYCSRNNTSGYILVIEGNSDTLFRIHISLIDNLLRIYKGSDLVAQGAHVIEPYTWYVIEFHAKISDADGIVECRVNGIIDSTYTGDTKPGADTGVRHIVVCNHGSTTYHVDDIIINTNAGSFNKSWPNMAKVCLIKPTAPGYYTQWTPSTGANWECVDDIPPSITDYVCTNSPDQIDCYNLENVPAEIATIQAIRVDAFAIKTSYSPVSKLDNFIWFMNQGFSYIGRDVSTSSMSLISHIWEICYYGFWTDDYLDILQAGMVAIT